MSGYTPCSGTRVMAQPTPGQKARREMSCPHCGKQVKIRPTHNSLFGAGTLWFIPRHKAEDK